LTPIRPGRSARHGRAGAAPEGRELGAERAGRLISIVRMLRQQAVDEVLQLHGRETLLTDYILQREENPSTRAEFLRSLRAGDHDGRFVTPVTRSSWRGLSSGLLGAIG
jgi:hypothetical protein